MLSRPIRLAFAAAAFTLPLAAQTERLQLRWQHGSGEEPVAVRVDGFAVEPARVVLVLGLRVADLPLGEGARLRAAPDLVVPLDAERGWTQQIPRELALASLAAPIYVQAIALVGSDACSIVLLSSMLWRIDCMRTVPMPLVAPLHLVLELTDSVPMRWSLAIEADVPLGPAELRVVAVESSDAATRVLVRLDAPATPASRTPPIQVLHARASGCEPGELVEVWLGRGALGDEAVQYERVELFRTR